MSVVFVLVPIGLVIGVAAIAAFLWATRQGQFDDLDTPALRILGDDPNQPRDRDQDRHQP